MKAPRLLLWIGRSERPKLIHGFLARAATEAMANG
jgi:hypothetical protein